MSRLSPTPCCLPQTPRRCWPGSRAAHSRRTRTAGAHRRRYGQLECGRWKDPGMTANEILHLVTRMPGAVAVTASEADRAPEPAGRHVPLLRPRGRRARQPSTPVRHDRDQGFRRIRYRLKPEPARRVPPSTSPSGETSSESSSATRPPLTWTSSRLRLRAVDQLLPHPVYASQSWVYILNPGAASSAHARVLLSHPHTRASERHQPRPWPTSCGGPRLPGVR